MNDAQIPKRWLPVIKAVWLALVLLLLAIFTIGISPYFDELNVPCSAEDCLVTALSPQEVQELRDLGLTLNFYAGYIVGLDIFAVVIFIPLAGLIFWRRSDSWLGFLLSLTLLFFASISALSTSALVSPYPSLLWPLLLMDGLASILFVLLFYLFPDGRFVPRWTRVMAIALFGGAALDLLFFSRGQLVPSYGVLSETLWLVSLLVGALAQIYRYRRVSSPIQRQQTKWIMFGLIIVFTTTFAWSILFELFPLESGSARLALKLGFGIPVLLFTIFPVSVGFSILRYRLWDIDIVINRSLVYGSLTGVLALIYFGSVVLLQSFFRTLTEQGSPIAIVISTLVIAALFSPLRRRMQEFIDRRFYRRKYDAEQILGRFAASVRDEADLDRLTAELQRVSKSAMQAEHVSIWLKETAVEKRS
jgi:hypothetical protein